MNDTGFVRELILSVLTAVIAENFVFARAFGISPMIAAAKNNSTLPGVCIGVSYFMLTASAAMFFVSQLPLSGAEDRHFLVVLYAFIVGGIYLMTLLCVFLFARTKFSKIKKYVHISAFNSAVMGTIFLCASDCTAFGEYLLFGLTAGAGFSAASYMLSGVYPMLYSKDVPRAFRGFPAVMIFSGIMAMAVYGILGHAPSFI